MEHYLYAVHLFYLSVFDFKHNKRRILRLLKRNITDIVLIIKQPFTNSGGRVFLSQSV